MRESDVIYVELMFAFLAETEDRFPASALDMPPPANEVLGRHDCEEE
jgi:hypothetical protein